MTTIASKPYDRREWQTVALLGLIALSVVSYIFFTHWVVFYAVGKQAVARQITTLNNEITTLEAQLLGLDNQITLDLAYALGFRDSGTAAAYTATGIIEPHLFSWRDNGRE